jgi:hypothetical protein
VTGGHEEAQEVDLMWIAVHVHEHAAAWLDDANHLPDALRHVRKQHHAELRSSHVEAVVVEVERLPISHAGLDLEPLLARARLEQVEHGTRQVRRYDPRAEAGRRDAEGAAARRHVEEPHPRA